MDFIDEEQRALLQLAQDADEILGAAQGWATGHFQRCADFFGQSHGQGGLAEARQTREKQVFESFLTSCRGSNHQLQRLEQIFLAEKL